MRDWSANPVISRAKNGEYGERRGVGRDIGILGSDPAAERTLNRG